MDKNVEGTNRRAARRIKAAKKQAKKRAEFDSKLKQREERLVSPSIRSAEGATRELLKRSKKKNTM